MVNSIEEESHADESDAVPERGRGEERRTGGGGGRRSALVRSETASSLDRSSPRFGAAIEKRTSYTSFLDVNARIFTDKEEPRAGSPTTLSSARPTSRVPPWLPPLPPSSPKLYVHRLTKITRSLADPIQLP